MALFSPGRGTWCADGRGSERRAFRGGLARAGELWGAAAGAETLLNRALLGVDVLLAGLDDAMPIQGQGPSSTWPGEEAQRLLSGVVKRTLIVRDVVLVSEDGAVLASALPATKRL